MGRKSHMIATYVNYSEIAFKILSILYHNGVIRGFHVEGNRIVVYYKFYNGKPVLSNIELISRPVKENVELNVN